MAKAIRRKALSSALASKKTADAVLKSLVDIQTGLNKTMAKIKADNAAALDTDYEATCAMGQIVDWDKSADDHGHRAPLRKALKFGLYSRELAGELIACFEELQLAHDAMCAKLDAEAGTLAATDWADLKIEPITDGSAPMAGRAHQSMKRWLEVSLCSKQLSTEIIEAIKTAQEALNATLDALDAGTIASVPAAQPVIEPDARM